MFDGFSAMEGFRFRKLEIDDDAAWSTNDDPMIVDHTPTAHVIVHNSGSNADDVEPIIRDALASVSVRCPFPRTAQHGNCLQAYLIFCIFRCICVH